ncbi:MAG: hypothetical protein WDA27_14885, partial [Actinomycetota bacterium]
MTNWTSLYTTTDLADLGQAQTAYYASTNETQRAQAANTASTVTLRAVGRHLALKVTDEGMPIRPNLANLGQSSDYNATILEWDTGAKSNLRLERIEIHDEELGWVNARVPGLVGFTPMRLVIRTQYEVLNGDVLNTNFSLLVAGENGTPPNPPVLVHYADNHTLNVVSWSPNNRDHAQAYVANSSRPHALTLLNASANGALLGYGLFDDSFLLGSASNVTVCARELWTANASGSHSNLETLDRLAIRDASESTCTPFSGLNEINLAFFSDLLVSAEIRQGNALDASYQIVGEPLDHLQTLGESTTHTLSEAVTHYQPTAWEKSARTGHIRLVITLPVRSSWETSYMLADVIHALRPTVGVFAVLIEDLPLTPHLALEVEQAADQYGSIILVPSGTLPQTAWSWRAQDKLMTIQGLAASPRVLTIGAGEENGGIASWSRLGPTPALTPKPDFVAPSPIGTTLGSVLNALPYVEATALRGVHEVDLVRAVLSSLAVNVRGQYGAPATYYEQGLGALDLGAFLAWNTSDPIDQLATSLGQSRSSVFENVTANLNITQQTASASTPGQLLGAAAPAEPLVRAAVTKSLLNVTIDTPAFPASLQVDFGVVNNKLPGVANFSPIDLDALLNATTSSYQVLLEEAGYTGTELANLNEMIHNLVQVRALEGQDVTLNVTHYAFFDLLEKDLLYTLYDQALNTSVKDVGGILDEPTQTDLTAIQSMLEPWLLNPYYLADERSGQARLPVNVGTDCASGAPIDGTLALAEAVLRLLHAEANTLEGTTKAPASLVLSQALPTSIDGYVSEQTQDYLKSQGGQLVCLQDQRVLLAHLKDWTTQLRDLKRAPWGALNQTESLLGTYDQTQLGREVRQTAIQMGIDPTELASKNASLALDQALDVLERAITLLDEKLSLVGVPFIETKAPEGLTNLTTNASRTRDAPLGLFVGLARMTS